MILIFKVKNKISQLLLLKKLQIIKNKLKSQQKSFKIIQSKTIYILSIQIPISYLQFINQFIFTQSYRINKSTLIKRMIKQLTVSQWINIKTKKCSNPQCPIGQMFSNQVRARYYQLVFANDKLCFSCDGYHTQNDKKRSIFEFNELTKQTKLLNDYQSEYLIDFSSMNDKKSNKAILKTDQNHVNKQLFSHTCQNLIQYLYHPVNYKSINCPLNNNNSQSRKSSNNNICAYNYCPFLHQGQTLNPELQKILNSYKSKYNQHSNIRGVQADNLSDKKDFQDKILNIMLLRACKSIDDLYKRQTTVFSKQNQSAQQITSNTNTLHSLQIIKHNFPLQDREQIQKIKQKLVLKSNQCLRIDKQKQKQIKSRKIIDKNFSKQKQNKNKAANKSIDQIQNDILGVSYNYFKYGQKVDLIQGRTIQFKHFKDISDPNHIPLILRYIAAFLNTEGGKLYIGIDDNSYAYGSKFSQSQFDKLLLKIDHQGKFYMQPPLMPQKYNIKRIPVYHDRKGQQRWVIQITVFPPKDQNKKLFLYNRECYMRMNASTHKLNASDIIQLISLNSQNQGLKQESLSPIIQKENNKLSKPIITQNKITQNDQTLSVPRQNQLMSQAPPASALQSSSKSKFQTEESKVKEFQQKLNKKSIQDLYLLRKDYEQKLNIIVSAYKKKERQMR